MIVRTSITLAADGSIELAGNFDWFCLALMSTIGGSIEVEVVSSNASAAVVRAQMDLNDVLEDSFSKLRFHNPGTGSVTFTIVRGTGRFKRNQQVQGTAGQFISSQRQLAEFNATPFIQSAAAATTRVALVANVNGVRMSNVFLLAHGDGANDGYAAIGMETGAFVGKELVGITCDKADGPVWMQVPDFDIPAGFRVYSVTSCAKDRIRANFQAL